MASPENLLLYLSPDDENAVRKVFTELARRGFPTQHQTPHITLTFSPAMQPTVVHRAASLLRGLVPAEFQRVGTVVFGTKRKQTVAWLLETTNELEEAARELSALNPDGRGNRWTPHLTVGLRLPREIVPDYVAALDELDAPRIFQAVTAGYWRPDTQELRVLAGQPRPLN
ncbi:2'-5' RNA ligase family protein [Corynebacterium epidermidicanis]|uniref:2'-5' RNA ligase superfamily n=1 Tax=Corynebacterium epidermidicanis TaxID=1050174 RepID=A0A0G3GSZ0_9CORY|nr:2'-5' RNA ligase family protein [Corynebacterium epidermidicanis]AKK04244.1 2'-5' RNA ligase superfamily [Corynebacterium epidermidicanis]